VNPRFLYLLQKGFGIYRCAVVFLIVIEVGVLSPFLEGTKSAVTESQKIPRLQSHSK